ncbi:glycosyltransferase family 9 protein [Candidatus Micrarchaeota archaeon]|nr:glycosyltransferase family 9 protein [Candidatus Micrarchaeota archaeon]
MISLSLAIDRFVEKNLLPFVCFVLGIFKTRQPPSSSTQIMKKSFKKILVIRFWAVGESILVLPTLKSLKNSFPDSELTLLCTPKNKDVFLNQIFIDRIESVTGGSLFFFMLKNLWKYDLCIDTEPHFAVSAITAFFCSKFSIGYSFGDRSRLYDLAISYNDKQHATLSIFDLISPLGISVWPSMLVSLKYSPSDVAAIDSKFSDLGISSDLPIIGIHAFCGPTANNRAWPKENFAKLIDRIKEKRDCIVILTGFGKEAQGNLEIISMLKNKSNVFSIFGISQGSLFYLTSKYSLMISNDTGPMHVSAAMGTRTIGLFGPNTPVRFGPFPPQKHFALYKAVHPPSINVHLNQFDSYPCDGECMRAITVDEVFALVMGILSS